MWLLKKNCSLTDSDSNGNTALHYISVHGITEVVKAIIFQPNGATLFNVVNREGWASVHYAALTGRSPVMAVLSDSGCDMFQRTHDTGESPLDLCRWGRAHHGKKGIMMMGTGGMSFTVFLHSTYCSAEEYDDSSLHSEGAVSIAFLSRSSI